MKYLKTIDPDGDQALVVMDLIDVITPTGIVSGVVKDGEGAAQGNAGFDAVNIEHLITDNKEEIDKHFLSIEDGSEGTTFIRVDALRAVVGTSVKQRITFVMESGALWNTRATIADAEASLEAFESRKVSV